MDNMNDMLKISENFESTTPVQKRGGRVSFRSAVKNLVEKNSLGNTVKNLVEKARLDSVAEAKPPTFVAANAVEEEVDVDVAERTRLNTEDWLKARSSADDMLTVLVSPLRQAS